MEDERSEVGVHGDAGDANPPVITVRVKFHGRTIPVSISPESTVRDLKSSLQPLTNVLPRGKKFILEGTLDIILMFGAHKTARGFAIKDDH